MKIWSKKILKKFIKKFVFLHFVLEITRDKKNLNIFIYNIFYIEIKRLYNKRRRMVHQKIKCANENRKQKLNEALLNNDIALKEVIKKKERDDENAAIMKTLENPKYIFSYLNKKRINKSNIGPLKDVKDEYTSDAQEMRELLNKQFKMSFTEPDQKWHISDINDHFDVVITSAKIPEINVLEDFQFSEEDIGRALTQIKNNSATGPDSWNAKFLKECKNTIAKPLYILWRASLDTNEIPQQL